jgi:hypothetical protein
VIRTTRTVEVPTWVSTVEPGLQTEDPSLAEALAWSDANPVAFHIVTEKRSAVFGRDSSEYMGHCRDRDDCDSVLRRIDHLRRETLKEGIFGWRARFTMERYLLGRGSTERKIRGDLFRLWDGEYFRSALFLDYTGETIEVVIDQFVAWCDPLFKKVEVCVGDRVGRRFTGTECPGCWKPFQPTCKGQTKCVACLDAQFALLESGVQEGVTPAAPTEEEVDPFS